MVLFQSKITTVHFHLILDVNFSPLPQVCRVFSAASKFVLLFNMLNYVCVFADCINSHVQTGLTL